MHMKNGIVDQLKNRKKIRRFAFLRYARRVALLLLWYVIWGVSIYQYAEHDGYILDIRYVLLALAVLVLGYLLFGIHSMLMDSTYSGRIESVTVTRSFTWFRGIPGCSIGPAEYLVMILKIRSKSHGVRRLKIPLKDGYNLFYREGVSVTHLFGVPFPIINDHREGADIGICCVCGEIIKDEHAECRLHLEHDLANENELLLLGRELAKENAKKSDQ